MLDWAPIIIGYLLFVLLSPGLIFQLPGSQRHVEFGSFNTNGKAILLHTLLFFVFFTILILAFRIRIRFG
ncbi:hypothetical protein R3W88_017889 [Solanum pinnatisectum]|uniref:Uncharacterized protein n=1 Tax=Solanum pinnatisectum TaxID=50273 RepID=A0AAV9L1V1_9SOLN|nr:hypothetical protein R3W88_017889 [Solanum pinnatisectum]